jgi:hypothetical protein
MAVLVRLWQDNRSNRHEPHQQGTYTILRLPQNAGWPQEQTETRRILMKNGRLRGDDINGLDSPTVALKQVVDKISKD